MKGDFISLEEGSLPLEKLLKEEEVFILGGCAPMMDNGCNCDCGSCAEDNQGHGAADRHGYCIPRPPYYSIPQ